MIRWIVLAILLWLLYVVFTKYISSSADTFSGKGRKRQWKLFYYFKPHCPYCVDFQHDWLEIEKSAKNNNIEPLKIDISSQIVKDV